MPFRHRQVAAAVCITAAWIVGAAPAQANSALANKHGCLGCHANSSQLVGPAYQAVAAKYGSAGGAISGIDKTTVSMLAQSIRKGGSGKWGEMAMPPQAQLSEADAKRLAAWILGGAK